MLFGHQNDDTNQPAADALAPQGAPLAPPPAPGAPADPIGTPGISPLTVSPSVSPSTNPGEPSLLDQPKSAAGDINHAVIEPVSPFAADKPATIEPASLDTPEPKDATGSAPSAPVANPANDNLLHLKQQALSQLTPLVNHLEQTPEEKFRTTMMLIQSTDNQALLQEAYDAAQAITDEKARAQALLDVVNEINYFTQAKSAA